MVGVRAGILLVLSLVITPCARAQQGLSNRVGRHYIYNITMVFLNFKQLIQLKLILRAFLNC